MKRTDPEIIEAMSFIKDKHNGELPYKFGTFECAVMMALYKKTNLNPKKSHNFKLGDLVYYPVDEAPFEVVGVRKDTVEIQGDFSGGTHNVCQKDWVKYTELEIYDKSKVKVYGKL